VHGVRVTVTGPAVTFADTGPTAARAAIRDTGSSRR